MEERDGPAMESHKLYHQNYFYRTLIRLSYIYCTFHCDDSLENSLHLCSYFYKIFRQTLKPGNSLQ